MKDITKNFCPNSTRIDSEVWNFRLNKTPPTHLKSLKLGAEEYAQSSRKKVSCLELVCLPVTLAVRDNVKDTTTNSFRHILNRA